MRYIETTVNGKSVRLDVLKETPLGDGTVRVLIIPPGGAGARSIGVDAADIKGDES